MNIDKLINPSRLLCEGRLKPVQGTRFQPTGFPDLGAATYATPDGKRMLLVESAQSMANRLEAVCWDDANDCLIDPLHGLPYVVSTLKDGSKTNSILEAHRLNSPFIAKAKGFEAISSGFGYEKNKPFSIRKAQKAFLKYDPCSLIHGIFLEKVAGVIRSPRVLTSFIEAENVDVASSGGVKIDRVQPETRGDSTPYGKANEGFGNVPFHRDEYTGDLRIYFNVDLALVRGFGFDEQATKMLIGLALFKIRALLEGGMRLRTACDLELDGELTTTRPEGFELPSFPELLEAMPGWVKNAKSHFADPAITQVRFEG